MKSEEHTKKSAKLLRAFHRKLAKSGIESQLCLVADHSEQNHIHVESVRIKTNLKVTMTKEYQIEISITGRRYQAAPDAAIDIIFDLAKKMGV